MFKDLLKIALFTLALCLCPFLVSASSLSLSISPQKFEFDLFPGEDFYSKISVSNRNDIALPVSVRVLTFDAAEDTGKIIFVPQGEENKSPGLWFDFEQEDIILEPGERRELNFQISVPQETEPGGYSAFIIFEPRLPSNYFSEGAAKAIPAIGAPALISAKSFYLDLGEKEDMEVVEFSLKNEERVAFFENSFGVLENILATEVRAQEKNVQATQGKPGSFILRIKNNSNFHLKPEGKATIKNFFGRSVGEVDIPRQTILPGKIRMFPVELNSENDDYIGWIPNKIADFLSKNLFAGRYKVELDISSPFASSSGNVSLKAQNAMILYSIPWAFWFIVILILIFVLFVLRKHDRVKKAFNVLIGKNN